MICIYAFAKVKAGCRETFLEAAKSLIHHSRAEAGNIKYHLAKESENRYVFIELWRSEEDIRRHMETPHFLQAGSKFQDLLESPLDIHKLEAVI